MSAPAVEASEVRIHRIRIEDVSEGLGPLAAVQAPMLTTDGSAVVVELESRAPRGPWLVVDLTTGQARVGRRLPQVFGGLMDGARALLGTSGGLIEVDLVSAQILRELSAGVGKGRESAMDSLLRLDDDHVLVSRLDRRKAALIDLTAWAATARRLPVAPPWVLLEGSPFRVWSLPLETIVSLDGSGRVADLEPAPAAVAAVPVEGGVAALVGTLHQGAGPGWRHSLGRDLLPTRFQHWLHGPLEGVELALLDGHSLEVVEQRPLRDMTRAVEGTLGLLEDEKEPEHWTPGAVGSALSRDVHGRLVVLGDRELFVLDPATLRPILHKRLPGDLWSTREGVSCAVSIGGERTLVVADW